MAKKGGSKVKTGCATCKIRKVKCDETKPACKKCATTGRKCDGYAPRRPGEYSWDQLLNPTSLIEAPSPGRTTREARALDFFNHVVAPGLSLRPGCDFWTRLVPQASEQEPAVRHAVVAISSMYERLGDTQLTTLDPSESEFALAHYNYALQQLRSKPQDESMMLFVCILFVCIEAMRGNHEDAIEHCRHGVMILNNSPADRPAWSHHYLVPMMVRMSIFPYFFGQSTDTFPRVNDPEPGTAGHYFSLEQAQLALDYINIRFIRFIRATDPFREGELFALPFPEEFYREQEAILLDVDRWLLGFAAYQGSHSPCLENSYALRLRMSINSLVCKIWVASALTKNETVYDQYMPLFREIVDSAEQLIAEEAPGGTPTVKQKFTFEMGFLSLLYFVVIKCRDLNLRYRALKAMDKLSITHEHLWNSRLMYVVGRRLIEREHGIDLARWDVAGSTQETPLLPDERRIRDSRIVAADHRLNRYGQTILHRKAIFIHRKGQGFQSENEWLAIAPVTAPTRVALSPNWHVGESE